MFSVIAVLSLFGALGFVIWFRRKRTKNVEREEMRRVVAERGTKGGESWK